MTAQQSLKRMTSAFASKPNFDKIKELAQKLGVDMPITEHVYHVLHRGRPLEEAVRLLVSREFKAELDGIRDSARP